MSVNVRHWIRNRILRFGWDVRRVQSIEHMRRQRTHDEQIEHLRFLKSYGLRSVLDIGANTGQFAALAREVLPDPKIYSFEPLASCYAELCEQIGRMQPAEAFHFALGDENGTAPMRRNEFTPSSSLLSMNRLHWEELPESERSTEEMISIRRLDDVLSERVLETPLFVKIDVQGFEDRVLRGGAATIRRAVAVVLEMSAVPLYDGQPLFDDLYPLLRDWGFAYRGNIDQFRSRRDGRILQFDALFENTNLTNKTVSL
ncbi:MAG TPA: FkbM family methyltransferase [Planctomycetaceae bacterium]|jgi:FkbM family methyltransferase